MKKKESMDSLLIERYSHGPKQTIGRAFVLDEEKFSLYDCYTLELPWKENERNISCIPDGEYQVEKRYSRKFGWHFHITDVEDRKWILIHAGNFYTDIRGCMLVGKDLKEINGDGIMDVTSSRDTMADLLGMLPKKFKLKIVSI